MAASSRFVDYSETDKPGLYQFKDGSGGSRLLYGTAAEEIKTGIDKGRASVAGALGSGKMSPDEWNAMGTPPTLYNEAPAAPAPVADERTAGGRSVSQAERDRMARGEQGRVAPPTATDAGGAGPIGGRTRTAAGGQLPANVQPSPPGVTQTPVPVLTPEEEAKFRSKAPGQAGQAPQAPAAPAGGGGGLAGFDLVSEDKDYQWYQKRGSNGSGAGDIVKVRKGQAGSAGRPGGWRDMQATQQGGYALDEDMMAQQQMSSGVREMGIEENLATNEMENSLASQEIDRQASLAAHVADEERRRQDDVQRFADHAKTEFEKYTAQVNSAQINPDRIYSGEGGKAREVRHRIASIFGAFGSTLAKSPNFVAERLARMKEDDIAAQEKDLLKSQGQRDTALKYFRDLTGDLDSAKQAVRAAQSEQNILALKKIEALAKTPRDKTAARVAIANEREAYEQAREAYMRGAAGTRSVSSQNLMPVAGSAGRAAQTMAPTTEERKGLVENSKSGKSTSEVEKTLTGQYGDARAGLKLLEKYPDDYVPPTKENSWVGSRAAESATDFVAGEGTYNRAMKSPEELQAVQDAAMLDYQMGAAQAVLGGQGALSGQEAPQVKAGISPGATMGEKKRALNILVNRLEEKAKAQGISVDQLMQQNREAPPQ